ncbi:MAG: histidine kinase [Actinomycetota bacterium]|nr:histidine kinase [Actinomycetota bacterium]
MPANVARVLHDDLQQQLHAVSLQLGLAAEHLDARELEHLRTRVELARRWLRDSIATVRNLCAGASAVAEECVDIAPGTRAVVADVAERFGLEVDARVESSIACPPGTASVVVDAARELLFNVVKHAGCGEARLDLRQAAGVIELVVADVGRGPSAAHRTAGTGLARVRDGVEELGGTIRLGAEPGGGCVVVVRLPAATMG